MAAVHSVCSRFGSWCGRKPLAYTDGREVLSFHHPRAPRALNRPTSLRPRTSHRVSRARPQLGRFAPTAADGDVAGTSNLPEAPGYATPSGSCGSHEWSTSSTLATCMPRALWAGLLDGTVDADDDWHNVIVEGDWRLGIQSRPTMLLLSGRTGRNSNKSTLTCGSMTCQQRTTGRSHSAQGC